jgi:hypothetical protein
MVQQEGEVKDPGSFGHVVEFEDLRRRACSTLERCRDRLTENGPAVRWSN